MTRIEYLKSRYEAMLTQRKKHIRPYLLLDGTWQEDLVEAIRQEKEGWEALTSTAAEPKQETHRRSPLLINLSEHPEFLDAWLTDGFGEKLGMVVFSALGLEELKRSLKRFLSVLTPDEKGLVLFRFFDARVLHCFLRYGFPTLWKDFFQNISLIAAPADNSDYWTYYRLDDHQLKVGVEFQEGEDPKWYTLKNEDREDDTYPAAFPFRSLVERHYREISHCSEELFCYEIWQFLKRAFPEETKGIKRSEAVDFIRKSHLIAKEQGFDEEDCLYYWAVLSFMGGFQFFEQADIVQVLKLNSISRETRLADLIYISGEKLENAELLELGSNFDIVIEDKSGQKMRLDKWEFLQTLF